jgi:predicted DNA-binding transcriptional regulator AlpA
MNTLTNSGRFKQIFTVPEAACLWAGVPLDQLTGAAFLSACIPLIVGRPDVSERAQSLMEACDQRTIEFSPVFASEDGPELVERRTLRKDDLTAWLKANFTGADAKLGGGPPPDAKQVPAELVPLLLTKDVVAIVRISRAQIYRLIEIRQFPEPDFRGRANKWKQSTINEYLERKGNAAPKAADI